MIHDVKAVRIAQQRLFRGETDVILTGINLNDEVCILADEVSKIETLKFKTFPAG